jgi:cis-2,3-dihydrobiphenyl-2,3-diol dehydrogenase
VITGAGSGIGRGIARRFVAEGARVVAFDRAEERLATLPDELGDAVATVVGDVQSIRDNLTAVARAVASFGKLDVFVANAGISDGFRRLLDLAPDEIDAAFDQIVGVNLRGPLLGARAAVPELLKTRGVLLFTVSNAGFYTGGGGPIYTASKHAVVGLVRQLAFELAPVVRVNGVAPGGTLDTSLRTAEALSADEPPFDQQEREQRMRGNSLLQIAARSDDHAPVYAFLASDEARLMTGVVLNSDGGMGVKSPLAPPRTA